MSEKQKIELVLFRDSWRNILDSIHARETRIESLGNFWAAIQALERQFEEKCDPTDALKRVPERAKISENPKQKTSTGG